MMGKLVLLSCPRAFHRVSKLLPLFTLTARCLLCQPSQTCRWLLAWLRTLLLGACGLSRRKQPRDQAVSACNTFGTPALPEALITSSPSLLRWWTCSLKGVRLTAVAPVLAGASLVALPKPAGGVRWNCSAGSRGSAYWLLSRTRRGLFWPAQVGVAVKGGAEKAVHAVRAWSHRHAGSIDKEVLRQATAFPSLARWATWCYRQPSRLQFGDRTLDSSAGVQQGDPLGPLLFLWPCNRWRVNSVRVLWTWPCISWTMACLLVTLPPWELRSS